MLRCQTFIFMMIWFLIIKVLKDKHFPIIFDSLEVAYCACLTVSIILLCRVMISINVFQITISEAHYVIWILMIIGVLIWGSTLFAPRWIVRQFIVLRFRLAFWYKLANHFTLRFHWNLLSCYSWSSQTPSTSDEFALIKPVESVTKTSQFLSKFLCRFSDCRLSLKVKV